MTTAVPTDPPRSPFSRRVILLPAVLLTVLVALPWLLRLIGHHLVVTPMLRELVDSAVTLLLGFWVLNLIHREQRVARQHLVELERLSLTDPLTGLGNRRALERDLELTLSRSRRQGTPLALLYLDVDGLKRLNDRYGHGIGDETLRCLGAVLRSSSRLGSDAAYRVGGDEFVMALEADRAGAEAIAGRIALAFPERSPRSSSVSMGVVVWDGQATVAELLDQADTRMYRQKHPDAIYHWV